jgi:predicted HTH domain antitoxin
MTIQLNLPEDVALALSSGQDLSRAALESLAVEGYRTHRLSEEQIRRMLGFASRFQVHAFLREHDAYLNYSEEDLQDDLRTARELTSK